MATALAPVAPSQFDALKRGDEAALEALFRACYDVLERQAEDTLHDPAAAARAVEHAFVHVWADRETVESPAALEAALLHALHEETAREGRRRAAAQRMAGAGGVAHVTHRAPSVDEAWQAVHATLHPKAADTAGTAARRREEAKHQAASHVKALGVRRNPLILWSIVLVVGAAAAGAVWLLEQDSASAKVTAALASPDAASVKTEPGQMGTMKLGDGTNVALGPQSVLKVPPHFNRQWRAVRVDGAATFDVSPNPQLPFEVRAGDARIIATGTRFTVRKYADDEVVAVRVTEGSVDVVVGGDRTPVAAGGTVMVANGVVHPATADEVAAAVGWADGMVTFAPQTVEQLVPQMRRWFGLVLTVGDAALATRSVSFATPVQDPNKAIAALEKAGRLRVTWENKQMVLRDGATK